MLLNFFGAIDTEGVTASMRGLVLVITMPKFLPGSKFNWPRLLLTTQYFRWLKYYDNLVEDDEQEFLIGELSWEYSRSEQNYNYLFDFSASFQGNGDIRGHARAPGQNS